MTLPAVESIVITGCSGQLGSAFQGLLPKAVHLTRANLDLTATNSIGPKLAILKPSAIINCAAYTAVDRAEDEESIARVINTEAVGEMARFAATRGVPFVTFSTDYVFDGDASQPYVETDAPRPANAYGRSKRDGEVLALATYPPTLIIRTSWLISATHPCFVTSILRAAASRVVSVVDDQVGRPTAATDLAAATLQALDCGVEGILHLTNSGQPTSWFGLAREAVRLYGMDPSRIRPCTTSGFPTRARRPPFSLLDSYRWTETGLDRLPDWRASLEGLVRRIKNRESSLDA